MPTIELLIFLLVVAAGLELLSRRIGVPRPILLVIAGTLLALVPSAPIVQVQPDVVFFIFLPPLLYWAAINTSYREFRQNGRDIMLLAIGLVVATAAAVAAVAHSLLPVLSWPAAFALGAAVGPTDAVAATSIMERVGVPRNIVSILEGESLVNDATSLVIFEMAITAADTGQFSLGPAMLSFVWAAGGGVVVGLAAGWCVAQMRRWLKRKPDTNPVVETSLSLLTPFIAFLAADRVGVSGVLAVVTVGLYMGHASSRLLTATSRLQAINMWQVVDFLLEGLLFIIVGLGLPLAIAAVGGGASGLRSLLVPAALISAVVIVLRLAWVFPATYVPRYVRRNFARKRDVYPPWQNVFFEGWAGLRGAVSLVLALSIPFLTTSGVPVPGRDLVIFLTFVVILVTLVGQGLTLRPLIWKLGLEPDNEDAYEETRARLETARAALARLDQIVPRLAADNGNSDRNETATTVLNDPEIGPVVERLQDRYTHLVHRYSSDARNRCADAATSSNLAGEEEAEAAEAARDERLAGSYQQLRLEVIDAERTELIRLRDDGEISDGVLHRVERDLDLEQSLLIGRNT